MFLRNTSITFKLLTLILPPVICIILLVVYFTNQLNNVVEDAKKSLYTELYVSSSVIINADRDFYQAAIAEKELILSWDKLNSEERKNLITDFNENADQVKSRISSALSGLKENAELYNNFVLSANGKTMSELDKSFFDSYEKWLAAFDLNTNTGNINDRNTYFDSARDDINSMTDLIDEYAVSTLNRFEREVTDIENITNIIMAGMLLFIAVISVATILYLRNNIRFITKINNKIAAGQFNLIINKNKFGRGEVAQLCCATGNILERLNNYVDYIEEITSVLNLMAQGDMRIKLKHDYAGEFEPIKNALNGISKSLNDALSVISVSSDEVNTGANHVAIAAQSLAQGSSAQANSIDDLTVSISDIVRQIKENTQNALSAKTFSVEAGEEVIKGNKHMGDMLDAMNAINASSSEISKIMKVIDDIAFQTNILALNAAVEAARAGDAGKGFAVVADEVRNLAAKSAEASTQTAAFIEESVKAAQNGQVTASSTAMSLKSIEEKTLATKELIESISSASEAQSHTLERIKDSIVQISNVVQLNAATAEESSAASEELNAQSATLNSEISKFKLK